MSSWEPFRAFDFAVMSFMLVSILFGFLATRIALQEPLELLREEFGEVCPDCLGRAERVLYRGLPLLRCEDPECMAITGFWSFLWSTYFDEMFYPNRFGYPRTLWNWIRDGKRNRS